MNALFVSSALRGPQPSTSSSQFLSLPLYKSLDLQRELIREFETTHDFKIISVKDIERVSLNFSLCGFPIVNLLGR
jgi:hypothetical protein